MASKPLSIDSPRYPSSFCQFGWKSRWRVLRAIFSTWISSSDDPSTQHCRVSSRLMLPLRGFKKPCSYSRPKSITDPFIYEKLGRYSESGTYNTNWYHYYMLPSKPKEEILQKYRRGPRCTRHASWSPPLLIKTSPPKWLLKPSTP